MKLVILLAASFLLFSHPANAVETAQLPRVETYDQLVHAIRATRAASQARIEAAVEQEKVREAWETGKLIQEHILFNKKRAEYGKQVLKRLSGDLGMSVTELEYMVQFAKAYPISRPAGKLSWSHYQSLLSINDPQEREEVTKEAVEKGWNRDQVREEIRRRQLRTQVPGNLPEITPGPLHTYQIIRLKDSLKIDLGFGIYHDLPEKEAKKFEEGDIVSLERGKLKKIDVKPAQLFTYQAQVTQVVDGDTFHALIDLGFGDTFAQRVRLRRIDAPEILSSEGKEAKAYLEKILHRDCTARSDQASAVGTRTTWDECQGRILMKSVDIDQHGRPIADVWVKNKPVDQEMLDQKLAVKIDD